MLDEKTIKAVESALEKLKWRDVLAIDKTVSKGDRSEAIPVKGGVKVVRVRREEVKANGGNRK